MEPIRIKVKYVQCPNAKLIGEVRYIDRVTGKLHEGENCPVVVGGPYQERPQLVNGPRSWGSSNGSVVEAVMEAPSQGAPEQNPRGAGLKFDGDKPRWSLLMQGCAKALAGCAAVLTFGAKKYSANSWKQVENNKVRYRDALYRHLNAIESGELNDPESGLSHWDHVATNALFLSELEKES